MSPSHQTKVCVSICKVRPKKPKHPGTGVRSWGELEDADDALALAFMSTGACAVTADENDLPVVHTKWL